MEELLGEYRKELGRVLKRREELRQQLHGHNWNPLLWKRYQTMCETEKSLKQTIIQMIHSSQGSVRF